MADEDLSFLNLILMIGTMASNQMQQLNSAQPAARGTLLPKVRESINMLIGLKKRTEGHLSQEEQRVLETMISELAARYVRVLDSGPAAPRN
jgi:hypothetical protein